jgi:dihydroxycyclohexadiene carboxylate dehydrogenase
VNAITASLAWEVAERGIRVVGTAPGGTEAPPRAVPRNPNEQTAQEKVWYSQIVDQTVNSSLMRRYGTLDEQAGVILFLASDDASYLTGVTIPVGGGDLG